MLLKQFVSLFIVLVIADASLIKEDDLNGQNDVVVGCEQLNKLMSIKVDAKLIGSDDPNQPANNACICYDRLPGRPISKDSNDIWIYCQKSNMPGIYSALINLPPNTVLAQLKIVNSAIPMIPPDMFANIKPQSFVMEKSQIYQQSELMAPDLRKLELRSDEIRAIGSKLLKGLRNLEWLDMSRNKIVALDRSSFSHLVGLERMILMRNNIATVGSDTFVSQKRLVKLDLSYNNLTTLNADTFKGLDSIEYLNLEGNKIKTIEPNTFVHLKNLKTLMLSNNQLESIEIVDLPNIETIQIGRNVIKDAWKVVLRNLPKLRVLVVDFNHLTQLPDLTGVSNLRVLTALHNQLKSFNRNSFSKLSNLNTLALQNNKIKRIQKNTFDGLDNLKDLYLSSNQLESIYMTDFAKLNKLVILNLSHNQIKNIEEGAFYKMTSLQKLFLVGNKLRRLVNGTIPTAYSTLTAVDLSENPWKCSCDNWWMILWLKDNNDIVLHEPETQCGGHTKLTLRQIEHSIMDHCPDLWSDGQVEGGGTSYGEHEKTSTWITILGISLGVVSLFIIIGIATLYWRDRIVMLHDKIAANAALLRNSRTYSPVLRRGDPRRLTSPFHKLRRASSDHVLLVTETNIRCTTTHAKDNR